MPPTAHKPVQIVFGLVCVAGGAVALITLRDMRAFRTSDVETTPAPIVAAQAQVPRAPEMN